MNALILYSTWPDRESAESAARALIEAHLAACVTLLPQALSFYRWEGAVQADQEVVMLVKTAAIHAQSARDFLLTKHPYDLPCVLALPVEAGASHQSYLDWIGRETL